jgi:hypothetical protein
MRDLPGDVLVSHELQDSIAQAFVPVARPDKSV